ncbi:MAG: PAS domain S-box protein [Ardenticatenaceae bacterium]|nr:PAS domain S-box protein [Ardenticatenaceae bacterium]
MSRFPFASLRARVILLVVLAALPALGLTRYARTEQRRQAAANVQGDTQRLARLAAADHERLIEGTRQLLSTLAQLPEVRRGDAAACVALLTGLLQDDSPYALLAVVDPEGNVLCQGASPSALAAVVDDASFRRALQTRDVAVGEYQIDPITQAATLRLSYPCLDSTGRIQAVVVAELKLDWLNQLVARAELPAGSTLTVYDHQGIVLLRYPKPGPWIGRSAAEAAIVKTVLGHHRGSGAEGVDLDGRPRLFAFTPLRGGFGGGDLYLSVGSPLAIPFANADRLLVRTLAGLGLLAGLALAAVWLGGELLLFRRVVVLAGATPPLVVDEPNRPTGLPGRVGKLRGRSRSVDDMALTLEQRTAQLHEAEARYRSLVEQIPAVVYEAASHEGHSTLYVSPQIETLLGFLPAEWMADPALWLRQLHPDDRERVLTENSRSRTTGKQFSSEYRLLARDGRVVWIRDNVTLVRDGNGNVRFQQGVMLDITARKRAEEERSKLLSAIVQTADSVMIATRSGVIEYVNPGFEELTGYTREEAVGKTPRILNSGHHDTQFYEELWKTVLAGRVFRAVFTNRKKNGQLYYQEETITPVRDASGTITHFVSTGRDITARRRAEEAVRESEARFRAIFEGAAIGMALVDLDGRVIQSNPTLRGMLGYAGPELHGLVFTGFTHPDDVATDQDLYSQVVMGMRDHYQVEKRYIRKDGTVVWGRLTVSLVRRTGAGARFTIQMVEDITAHKQAAEAEREQRSLAEALRDTAEALTSTLNLDEVLDRILTDAGRVVPHDAANIMLRSDGVGHVVGYRGCGERGLTEVSLGQPLAIAETPTLRQMTETRQPFIIPDLRAFSGWVDLAEPRWQLSYLGVPLCVKEEIIGFLNLDSAAPGFFTPAHAQRLEAFAHQAAAALENARLFAETERRLRRLQALHTIDVAITASLDLNVILDVLLHQVTTRLGVDAAAVLLLDPHSQTLKYAAGCGFDSDGIACTGVRPGEGYAGRVALERQIVAISDLGSRIADFRPDSSRFALSSLLSEGFVAYYCVPLVAKGRVHGVLELFHRSVLAPDPEWLVFLETLAGQAAIALDNATLFDDLQRSNLELARAYDTTLEGWSRALDLRDEATEGHTRRVTEMTLRLARTMGMSEAELVHVRRGALLHDIGKMGIPDRILLKSGPLTDEEWEVMRRHPVYAYELLAPIAFLRLALAIPYCHHEKWDGTGYPRGLKGEQIPLAARIFAIADVWDALRSDRPYNRSWPDEKVREHIRSLAGTHFDPQVVELFLQMVA